MKKTYQLQDFQGVHNADSGTVKNCSLPWLYEDAAILTKAAQEEFGEFGEYVSNVRDLADMIEVEILARLERTHR